MTDRPAGGDRPARPPRPCPVCGKMSVAGFHPFCSRRCADVDLNRWLSGAYAVPTAEAPGEDAPPAVDEGGDGR